MIHIDVFTFNTIPHVFGISARQLNGLLNENRAVGFGPVTQESLTEFFQEENWMILVLDIGKGQKLIGAAVLSHGLDPDTTVSRLEFALAGNGGVPNEVAQILADRICTEIRSKQYGLLRSGPGHAGGITGLVNHLLEPRLDELARHVRSSR